MRRQAISHKNPSSPGTANATRQPQRRYRGKIKKGAMAPPTDEPLSYKAAANARSRFGNHSETALLAPGQLADSPAPSKKRNTAKLEILLANEVRSETAEYHVTLIVRPADSVHQTAADGLPHGISQSEGDRNVGVIGVGPVVFLFEEGRKNGECLPVDIVDHCRSKQNPANPPAKRSYDTGPC